MFAFSSYHAFTIAILLIERYNKFMAKKKRQQVRPKQFILGPSGDPESVILSMDDFEKLLEMVEDVADVSWMEAMRSEEKHAIPWEDVQKQLRARGIL